VPRDTPAYRGAWRRAVDLLASVVEQAGELGLAICFEPLAPAETNFINTVEEGMKLVREVNHPSLKIHLDVKAMCSEGKPVAEIIHSVKAEDVGHFHVNDVNLYGPGMGDVDYAPIAHAVRDIRYDKWLSVEVFKYDPDPETIAKKSIDYLRRFWP
jgi:sugar phosphate isomerase/epimerase